MAEVLSDTLVRSTDDFLGVCVAEVDSKVFNKVLTSRKGLEVYGEKAERSIEAELERIIDREVWEGVQWR